MERSVINVFRKTMPPTDDPLARLHGRAAFADTLTAYFKSEKPDWTVEPWPVLGGFEMGKHLQRCLVAILVI